MGAVLTLTVPTSAVAAQIDGVNITQDDEVQLLTAMHTALKPNDDTIPIRLAVKSAADMPAYAKVSYYAGSQESKPGVRIMNVWVNGDANGPERLAALESSFFLALSDGGYGGTTFKELYDNAAAKDALLPPGTANPYANRQKLGKELVDELLNE